MKKSTYKLSRALLACLLAISMIFGVSVVTTPTTADAATGSVEVFPYSVQAAEKPYITIETNLVVDATGAPTGYVELALKVTTPTLYYADAGMEYLRFEGDYTTDGTTDSFHSSVTSQTHKELLQALGEFDPTDHSTYVTTRQTTFRSAGVTLEYNNAVLLPVSWAHEVEPDDETAVPDSIEYPDFFFDNYGYEWVNVSMTDGDGNTVNTPQIVKTQDRIAEDLSAETAGEDPNYSGITKTPEEVMADFNGAAGTDGEKRSQYSISVPVLEDDTDISSAMAYVQGTSVEGDTTSNITIEVTTSVDIAYPQETTLAVVRFYYTGEKNIADAIDIVDDVRVVDRTVFISAHDRQTGNVESLFNFAEEANLDNSSVQQILFYTAGNYVGYSALDVGENEFYSTKLPFTSSACYSIIEYKNDKGEVKTFTDGGTRYRPMSPIINPAPTLGDDIDEDRAVVLARTKENADRAVAGDYSYVSNLVYTSKTQQFTEGTNVRFTMAAEESYNAGGGTDIENVSTIVFLDWDDSILGALSVVKGDARAAVEAYVENFVHPSLRASNPDNASRLKDLATSLEREFTYAGKYPNTDENDNGKYEVATPRIDGNGNPLLDNDGSVIYDANDEIVGTNTFPDGYTVKVGDVEVDYSGSAYPLTNKLDYAFLRRPVLGEPVSRTPSATDTAQSWPYLNAAGKPVAATEWTTGVVDWDGEQTDTAEDDYFYIHGWALVAARERSADATSAAALASISPEKVWTTLSTKGYLEDMQLPGYDSDNDVNAGVQYTINSIRAAGTDTNATTAEGGSASAVSSSTEISFATYDESTYFNLFDFSKVEAGEIYVKACYEPTEQLNWNDYHTIISDEPYYMRYGAKSSVETGNVYTIAFEFERKNTNDFGVQRICDPSLRVLFIEDNQGVEGENSYKEGTLSTDGNIVNVEFSTKSTDMTFKYTLVEVYGYYDYVSSKACSDEASNVASVKDNFFYAEDQESVAVSGGNYSDGFSYANRRGSDGYVYHATLQQLLEQATRLFSGEEELNLKEFLSVDSLIDLNLRINGQGTHADGTLLDGTPLGEQDLAAILAYAQQLEAAQNAIYDACEIAYKYNYLDEDGVIDLDWHQLQYHIINYATGGIDLGSNEIRSPKDSGSYSWCRLDGCSEKVSFGITTLGEALQTINAYKNPVDDEAKAAALEALNQHLVDRLTTENIYKKDTYDSGEKITTRTDMKTYGAYTDADVTQLIDDLYKLITQLKSDMGTSYSDAVLGQLTNGQIQVWLMSDKSGSGDYKEPEATDPPSPTDSKHTYWWIDWEKKPYVVDFSSASTQNAAALLVEAAATYSADKNDLAWLDFDEDAMSVIEAMRFRASARGDFFTEGDYTEIKVDYDAYRSSIYDTSSRALVLEKFASADDFKTAIIELVTAIGDPAGTDEWLTTSDILAALSYSETASDDYSWYQIQYCLANGVTTPVGNPEDYAPTSDWVGTYWWRDRDMRVTPYDSDSGKYGDFTHHTYDGFEYLGATMSQMRNWLSGYVAGTTASVDTGEGFKAWFTPEVAADLILRPSRSGGSITEATSTRYAEALLQFAVKAKEANFDFSELTWSQVQYCIVSLSSDDLQADVLPEDSVAYASTKSAQSFTYSVSCTWGKGNNEDDSNRWREGRQAITALDVLIRAVESAATDPTALELITEPNDLTIASLYFKVDKMHSFDANLTMADILLKMRAEYETAAGVGTWENLALAAQRNNAWYLIQYYLYNGSFVTPTAGESVLAATAREGKKVYWWKDGWNGISEYSNLYGVATGDVGARVDWITTDGNIDDNLFKEYTLNIRSSGNTDTTWDNPSFASALRTMNGSAYTGDNWWAGLQFMTIHAGQANAFEVSELIADDEANAFYWWKTSTTTPTEAPDYKDVGSITTTTDAASAAKILMEAAILKFATGNVVDADGDKNDDILTTQNITDYLNLRVPEENMEVGDLREDMETYTFSDAELEKMLKALVKTVYSANTPKNASGAEVVTSGSTEYTWDYITDDGVYTYNAAAYNAVVNLSPQQIQKWIATYRDTNGANPQYVLSGSEDYWWIESDKKPDDIVESFKRFFAKLIVYSENFYNDFDSTNFDNAILEEWDSYGFSVTAETVVAEWNLVWIMLDLRGLDGDNYNWYQLQMAARIGEILTPTEAASKGNMFEPNDPRLKETLVIDSSYFAAVTVASLSLDESAQLNEVESDEPVYDILPDVDTDEPVYNINQDVESDNAQDSTDTTEESGGTSEWKQTETTDAIIPQGSESESDEDEDDDTGDSVAVGSESTPAPAPAVWSGGSS